MQVLLPLLIILPAATAVLLMLLRSPDRNVARWGALLGSSAALAVSLIVLSQFHSLPKPKTDTHSVVAPRFEMRHEWMTFPRTAADGVTILPDVKLEFFFGLDGISVLLVVLTTLLTVSSVLISWETIKDRPTEFYSCLLVLETGLLGAFTSFDLLLFYVFFEFTLIPLFLMVGIWGGPDRKYAAGKFFIYTLAGSLITLLGLVSLVTWVIQNLKLETPFSIPDLARELSFHPIPTSLQVTLFLMLSAGFLIKVPVFPFHSWLPLAHVEAPTAGSVLLAGVLLKLGTYGFLRICLTLLPEACQFPGVPLIAALSVVGIIYGALAALVQNDVKKLVAYSSVSHLGFCMLGLFALNVEGISGSVMQMVNHGLSTGALFLLVGMVYDRYHTRKLDELGGLASKLKLISICMIFTCFSSMGLPGLNGFIGEVLSLIGMFKAAPLYAITGATGVILGAWYLMTMLQKGFFGPLREPDTHGEEIHDLQPREALLLAPILALCLWIGVKPQPMLNLIQPDVKRVAALYDRINGRAEDRVADDQTFEQPQLTEAELPQPLESGR